MKTFLRNALFFPVIAVLAACTTYYPELDGQPVTDQYGYRYYNTGRCLAPGFWCSIKSSPSQKAHNRKLRAEEKRMERATERALKD